MKRPRTIELFLLQIVIYLIFWLSNDYLASVISVIFAGVIFFILFVSLIVEWIEPSKVPRWYFYFMGASVLAPVLVGFVYLMITGGTLSWVE